MLHNDVFADPFNTLGEPHQTVAKMRRVGWSFGRIGEALGMSRSAVAGMCTRLRRWGVDLTELRGAARLAVEAEVKNATPVAKRAERITRNGDQPPLSVSRQCQYIEGEPSADDRCKCAKLTVPGSPYCQQHHSRCFLKLEKADPEKAALINYRVKWIYR